MRDKRKKSRFLENQGDNVMPKFNKVSYCKWCRRKVKAYVLKESGVEAYV